MKKMLRTLSLLTVVLLALGACQDDSGELETTFTFDAELAKNAAVTLTKPSGTVSASDLVLLGSSYPLSLNSILADKDMLFNDIKSITLKEASISTDATIYLGNYLTYVELRLRPSSDYPSLDGSIGKGSDIQQHGVGMAWLETANIVNKFSGSFVIDVYARIVPECSDFSFPGYVTLKSSFSINCFE